MVLLAITLCLSAATPSEGRSYGPRGELRSVTLPGGGTWTYEYDGLNRLTTVTPPAGSASPTQTWQYDDGLGRVTRHEVGTGRVWSTSYENGRATTTTPNGESIIAIADGRGRLASVQYVGTGASAPGLTGKQLRWDGWDALVEVTEARNPGPGLTQTFGYDGAHRLATVTRGLATVTYGYQAGTRRLSSRSGVAYGYDSYGRVATVTGSWAATPTPVAWEPGGQRLTTLGAETFEYDGRGWLASVTTPQGVRRYGYDGRGNRLTETVVGGGQRDFAYDDADRLVAVKEWDGHLEAWQLKADGAKQEERHWAAGTPFTRPFSFATPNPVVTKQYTYRSDGVLELVASPTGDVSYGHDNNGQVTSRAEGGVTTTYGWDVDGRLVSATRPGVGASPALTATYEYDGLGMRRVATVTETPLAPAPPVTTTRTWTWGGADGEEEAAEDGHVTAQVAGYRVGEGSTRFWHDGLGSVVGQVDSASFTTSVEYSAWGTRSTAGPVPSSVGFTGHRLEEALGLSYAQRRWLDSATGTWLSRDDVGASSYLQSPNELNPWQYAAGNPTRFTDPSGRSNECGSEGGPAGPGGTPEACRSPEQSPEAKVLLTGMVCAVPAITGACVIGAGASGWQQSAAMVDAQLAGRPVPEPDLGEMAEGAGRCAMLGPALGKLPVPAQRALVAGGAGLATVDAAQDAVDGNYCTAGVKVVGALSSTAMTFGPPRIPNFSINLSPPSGPMPAMAVQGAGSRGVAMARPAVAAASGGPGGQNPLAVAMAAAGGSSSDDLDRWENEGGALGPTEPLRGIGRRVSQKQWRHILDRPEWLRDGKGGYFRQLSDAQAVLDAAHAGQAKVLGVTKQGHLVVEYKGVTGFNNNPRAGYLDQPTNIFMIKGSQSPSVVPISPQATPP